MALALLTALVVALGIPHACSSSQEGSAVASVRATADLRIAVWPAGKQRAARSMRLRLRCGPPGGTLARPARVCKRLFALRDPFRPVPRNAVCTQIYGGPQVAEIRGSFRGRKIVFVFRRTDGCQIERWDRVRFLFRS